jgi:hypothetical protein
VKKDEVMSVSDTNCLHKRQKHNQRKDLEYVYRLPAPLVTMQDRQRCIQESYGAKCMMKSGAQRMPQG